MFILQRACDEKVKVNIFTAGHSQFAIYILEIGEDYVKCKNAHKRIHDEYFIKLDSIESIATEWKE